jgi:multiple sugar transport system ATP-binding protein
LASIRLEGLRKTFPDGTVALRDLDLQVGDGELVVLVGPSGCGKTTALRLVAGLEEPSAGRIWLGEREVTDVPPAERDVAMVFQSYALYPHKSVAGNLGFPLRLRGMSRSEIAARVGAVASALGLEGLLTRRPRDLSGGQRQRVALGRAMVREPAAFLLDEPLSNLDAVLRVEMRAELARLHARLGATMVLVTHDQEEATTLGQRIVVLRDGEVEQIGGPEELYERPATLFVAGFLGSPAMNALTGRASGADRALHLEPSGARLTAGELALGLPEGPGVLGVRPEDLELVPPEDGDLRGSVEVEERLGRETLLHVGGEGGVALRVLVPRETRVGIGNVVGLRARRDRLHLFDAGSGRRLG